MPRVQRRISSTGFYHIMLRGNARQLLFESDADREVLLGYLDRALAATSVELIAWCLMDTHIHLLISDPDCKASGFVKRFATGYAMYFNKKADRVGHVFQDRFKSVPIESDNQLLQTVNYIHRNPEDAHICRMEEWDWSSYHEYVGRSVRTNTRIVIDMIDGLDKFVAFSAENRAPHVVLTEPSMASRHDIIAAAQSIAQVADLSTLKGMPKKMRDAALARLRDAGLSIRQIERLTGIGRGTISKVTVPS